MNTKLIGLNIKKRRNELGLSQAKLAEMSHLSTVHISHIETGNGNMSLTSFLAICESLCTTPNDILYGAYSSTENVSGILKENHTRLSPDDEVLLEQIRELLENRNTGY